MTYDTSRGQTVLFGGGRPGFNSGNLSETWIWDGTNWTQKLPAASPPARDSAGMVFDAARGQVVLFGGFRGDISVLPNSDTWLWNGSSWTQVLPPAWPPERSHGV